VSAEQDQESARRARAREVGLFRYGLIQDALDPALSTKQRGRLVREVAAKIHPGPFGPEPVRVSRASLDRWIRAYRVGGFAALVPAPRRLAAQTPPEVLELAVGLKRETPGRTAAQVAVVLAAHAGWAPSPRTLQRHFAALGLNRPRPDGALPPAVFGRFEAERPNARWVGDALHGPHVGGRKAILIAFLDDHSRAVMAARWGYAENAVALRETLRDGLAARGRPIQAYVDNGSMFIDAGLRRACAVLGIKLTHSQPGKPAGRGKIERFFRTVRDQFLVEITDSCGGADGVGTAVDSLAELNALFTAWVAQVYHPRVHSETQAAPLTRFLAPGPPAPTPADLLAEAFRWGEWRTVTKTATVSLHGNLYEVDPALAGTRVELVFDPFDLTDITVHHHGRAAGKAVPHQIGRHVHPKAATDPAPAPTPTGIDYLRLVEDRHIRSLGERLRYAQLADPAQPDPTLAVPTLAVPTLADPTPPAESTVASQTADAGPAEPAADGDGLIYSADLLTLAAPDPPDSAAPDSAAPDSAAPDSAAPDSAAPDSAAPDSEEFR
jgi:putative transposase